MRVVVPIYSRQVSCVCTELFSREFKIRKTKIYGTLFIILGDVKLSVVEGEVLDLLNMLCEAC